MGLFILLMIAGCIVCLFFLGKNREGNNRERNTTEPLTERDEFTGDSIRSFFLLEEIVDSGLGEQKSKNRDFSQRGQIEDNVFVEEGDYFEDEFFE